jgi:hypothetical protein
MDTDSAYVLQFLLRLRPFSTGVHLSKPHTSSHYSSSSVRLVMVLRLSLSLCQALLLTGRLGLTEWCLHLTTRFGIMWTTFRGLVLWTLAYALFLHHRCVNFQYSLREECFLVSLVHFHPFFCLRSLLFITSRHEKSKLPQTLRIHSPVVASAICPTSEPNIHIPNSHTSALQDVAKSFSSLCISRQW